MNFQMIRSALLYTRAWLIQNRVPPIAIPPWRRPGEEVHPEPNETFLPCPSDYEYLYWEEAERALCTQGVGPFAVALCRAMAGRGGDYFLSQVRGMPRGPIPRPNS
jgi:hypothetical protein